MQISQIIESTLSQPHNFHRGRQIYISENNIHYFAGMLEQVNMENGFLITPYLLSHTGTLYELHDYEFDVAIAESPSHYTKYSIQNQLPAEVVKQLYAQAVVAKGDFVFCKEAVSAYIKAMEMMSFREIKDIYPEFDDAKLVFQIFED